MGIKPDSDKTFGLNLPDGTIILEDLAALKAYDGSSSFVLCESLGLYRYDSDSEEVADDNIYVEHNSGSGKWVKLTSNVYSPSTSFSDRGAVYVASYGDDSNSGLSPESPKLTFQSAISKADSEGLNTVIEVDGGVYTQTESITCVDGINIYAPNATIDFAFSDSQIRLADCRCVFRKLNRNSGGTAMILNQATTGVAQLDCNVIVDAGSGITVRNTMTTVLILRWEELYARSGSAVITDFGGSGNEHIHLYGGDIYLEADNAIAVQSNNAGTDIIGQIEHIVDVGYANTVGLDINGGKVSLNVIEIVADTAYDVSAGAELNLFVNDLTGTETATGTANVTKAGATGATSTTRDAVYIASYGNDTNGGLNPEDALLTLSAAITKATSGSHAAIIDVDGNSYTISSTVALPSNLILDLKNSQLTISGSSTELQLNDNIVLINKLVCCQSDYNSITNSGTSNRDIIKINELDVGANGNSSNGSINLTNDTHLYLNYGIAISSSNGRVIQMDGANLYCEIGFLEGDASLAANNLSLIAIENAGKAYIQANKLKSTRSLNKAIYAYNANTEVKLNINEIEATIGIKLGDGFSNGVYAAGYIGHFSYASGDSYTTSGNGSYPCYLNLLIGKDDAGPGAIATGSTAEIIRTDALGTLMNSQLAASDDLSGTSGAQTVDMSGVQTLTVEMSGDVTLGVSNAAAGREVEVLVSNDSGGALNLVFDPDFTYAGIDLSGASDTQSIADGETWIVSLKAYGTNDSDVVVALAKVEG